MPGRTASITILHRLVYTFINFNASPAFLLYVGSVVSHTSLIMVTGSFCLQGCSDFDSLNIKELVLKSKMNIRHDGKESQTAFFSMIYVNFFFFFFFEINYVETTNSDLLLSETIVKATTTDM